jgi:hypothetical protein
VFNGTVLPGFLSGFGTSLVAFYVAVVYVVAGIFHGIMVPKTAEIFIQDAPKTKSILNICQAVYIYRFRRNYV